MRRVRGLQVLLFQSGQKICFETTGLREAAEEENGQAFQMSTSETSTSLRIHCTTLRYKARNKLPFNIQILFCP